MCHQGTHTEPPVTIGSKLPTVPYRLLGRRLLEDISRACGQSFRMVAHNGTPSGASVPDIENAGKETS